MANQKDLANGLIGTTLTSEATTLVLQAGYGNSMPAVPFFLTITPAGQLSTRGNSEIVNVTARTGDTLTIERAQKETTARAFSVGDVVSNSIYTDEKWTSDNIDWATFDPFVYSTTERRVGTWLEGNPVYRKTVVKANMVTGDTITSVLAANCTKRNLDSTVQVQSTGALYSANGTFWVTTTAWYSINYQAVNNIIQFRHGGSDTVTVTSHCYYTKNTD